MKDVQPEVILAALYNSTHPQGMGFLNFEKADMELDEARELLEKFEFNGVAHFDYLKGRVMKMRIPVKPVDPETLDYRLYDRDNRPGAGISAVRQALENTAV
jgi:hypothetical protein